jgi:hypothetical protein
MMEDSLKIKVPEKWEEYYGFSGFSLTSTGVAAMCHQTWIE